VSDIFFAARIFCTINLYASNYLMFASTFDLASVSPLGVFSLPRSLRSSLSSHWCK